MLCVVHGPFYASTNDKEKDFMIWYKYGSHSNRHIAIDYFLIPAPLTVLFSLNMLAVSVQFCTFYLSSVTLTWLKGLGRISTKFSAALRLFGASGGH